MLLTFICCANGLKKETAFIRPKNVPCIKLVDAFFDKDGS